MNEEERRFVFRMFAEGCPADPPDNIHIHIVRLERVAGFPVSRIKEMVKPLGVIGFVVKVRRGMVQMEVLDIRAGSDVEN